MILVLHCADRVSNTLNRVALTMREVVHRVYTPFVASTMVRDFENSV